MFTSSNPLVCRFLSAWAVVAVCFLAGQSAFGQGAIPYDTFTTPQGESYVAVGLQGTPMGMPQAAPEVVFLVDTAAGMIGQARRDTLAALDSAIAHLPEGTQIRLFTMDMETEALTPGFVAKGSPELAAAMQTLRRRVPLGATNMSIGLAAARAAFERIHHADGSDVNGGVESKTPETRRAVVYFGSGKSMAKTVDPAVFQAEVDAYVHQRIPFNACAVGIESNLGLIGALANHTGGNLINMNTQAAADLSAAEDAARQANVKEFDAPETGKTVGQKLAEAVMATVIWPEDGSYAFPETWSVYPQKLQPIRSDRATIVVAKTDEEGLKPFTLEVKGKVPGNTVGGEMDVKWNFVPDTQSGGTNYLAAVVETAANDGGLTMPIVGWETLELVRDGFIANVDTQIDKADAAIKTGNMDSAKKILNGVLKIDPTNKTAQNLFELADEGVEGEPEVMPENEAAQEAVVESAVGDSNDPAAIEPEAAMVDAVAIEQSVVTQKIQNEIRQTINDATQRMNSDPEGAIQNLKLALVMVRDNTALAPGERNMMLDRLGNTLKQVQHVQYVNDFRQQQADANAAAERERQQLLHDSLAQEVKAEQVFDRFKSLMIAGEYKVASDVATSAMQMLPDSTTPFTAQRLAEMTGNIIEYAKLRHQRHVGFVDSLMVAERSFIPVPEEPPLSYIDPERWMILSERRKERYAVSDLSQSGEAERSINKALEKNFTIDLDENSTFEDLIAEIKKQNSDVVINIGLDTAAADEAGVELTLSSPVVTQPASYTGIKLRSVLRLILKEHDLTYCIKDQVLTITTIDEAKLNMSIKVYPVADLVVSPEPIGGGMMGGMGGGMGGGMMGGGMMGGMGGGMGGGMMGGMGGGMGGMGGGMGGMGGGMGGMGGGMGMFSVPEEINREDFDAAKKIVAEAKKAENVREYWEQLFAQGQVTAEQIEQVVTRLVDEMKAKKPVQEHIIAVVESAILEDMVRPWMYEVLAIALYSNNAPATEVERAILSAAEFCDNPLDLLNVGFFMRSLGMKQRAFPLYKQALEAMPAPKQEFFAATLRLANELFLEQKDEESLRWVCLAILSFEWDGDNGQKMATDALDFVNVLKNSMERAGRTEEAAKLAQDIQEARLRDCIVTIRWTGDAALDLAVREPTDSFCWFNNPRTLSGGLVKLTPVKEDGKAITGTMTEAAGTKKISYVCPKGFNGTYVVVVQKDWGAPANNLVSIAVDTNVVAGEEKAKGSSFTLPPEGAIIQFALETGRRTETLEEAQLDVATIRMSVAQQQLARNAALRRLASDGLLGQVVGGPGGSGQGGYVGSGNSRDRYPFWGRSSVVGYQPVRELLPDGAMLASNAVVSADRRYVRMSPSPNFTSIRNVYSYNMQTGVDENSTNSGGMGNNNTGGNMSGGMGGSGGGMY